MTNPVPTHQTPAPVVTSAGAASHSTGAQGVTAPAAPVAKQEVTLASFATSHGLPDVSRWITVEEDITPRTVRKTLHDKLLSYGEYVEHLIYPEGLTDGWESAVFTEHEHEELSELHHTLALLDKDCTLLDIESGEAEELAMVKKLVAQWPALVTQMQRIINKSREAYKTKERHRPASYLG